jgi:uncharacterized membrane protein
MMEIMNSLSRFFPLITLAVWSLWAASGAAILSRIQLVFDYSTLPLVPPEYEILAGSASALAALLVFAAIAILAWYRSTDALRYPRSIACLLTAVMPLGLLLLRGVGFAVPSPGWWELLWFAAWTGVAVRRLEFRDGLPWPQHRLLWLGLLSAAVVACTLWWTLQSVAYHRDYQLGFNDFGHFTQRISNTANGRGFLLESPVLPPFWDHFNPGLVILVPVWAAVPRVEMIFFIQAFCLAGSAWLVAAIAVARHESAATACLWGVAWLLFPAIGQMNLAYTYGWHPITLAIPCLLAAYFFLCVKHHLGATAFAMIASTFEEGVLIVLACFAATQIIRLAWNRPFNSLPDGPPSEMSMHRNHWWMVLVTAIACFAMIYRFSGLAPFQTGRFARLGSNAWEIAISPILRPQDFWGLLLRPRNAAFTGLMLTPFAVSASRRWLWALLAVAPAWLVLMIWEHMPAQSLAFQYTSCLIPVLFIGMIEQPSQEQTNAQARAFGFCAVGWILSIAIGQFPWSNDSLLDVKAKTYGVANSLFPNSSTRSHGDADANLLGRWITSLRSENMPGDGSPLPAWDQLRILATGRLAAHCVGTGDVETVGQFWQRYDSLRNLDPQLSSPVLRYDVILLDFQESFQQTPEDTKRLLEEAKRHGWVVTDERFNLAILRRSDG